MVERKVFSFDTSAFIEPWRRHYPIDIAPDLWSAMSALGNDEIIIANELVKDEICGKDDDLAHWISGNESFFRMIDDDIQDEVSSIMQSHPALVASGKNRSGGDPWVIAQALVSNAAVVTYEGRTGNLKKPKIPDVCESYGIECIGFVDFLRATNIRLNVTRP